MSRSLLSSVPSSALFSLHSNSSDHHRRLALPRGIAHRALVVRAASDDITTSEEDHAKKRSRTAPNLLGFELPNIIPTWDTAPNLLGFSLPNIVPAGLSSSDTAPVLQLPNISDCASWIGSLVLSALPGYKNILRIEETLGKVEKTTAEIVDKVAQVTDKISSLEQNIADAVIKDSQYTEALINKVDAVTGNVETAVEHIADGNKVLGEVTQKINDLKSLLPGFKL